MFQLGIFVPPPSAGIFEAFTGIDFNVDLNWLAVNHKLVSLAGSFVPQRLVSLVPVVWNSAEEMSTPPSNKKNESEKKHKDMSDLCGRCPC